MPLLGSVLILRLLGHYPLLRAISFIWLSTLFLAGTTIAQWNPLNSVISVEQHAIGAKFALQSGTLLVQICSDAVIHVVVSPSSPVTAPENLAVVKDKWTPVKWTFGSSAYATIPFHWNDARQELAVG
jgi:hypothetical protein